MPTATKDKAVAPTDSTYKVPTVAQVAAMSKSKRSEALIEENAEVRRAEEAGTTPPKRVVANWINSPKNAEKIEADASKPKGERRVQFPVIPYPKGQSSYDLEKQTFKCEGACGLVKPVRSFPTTTPDKRTAECRSCRDIRQGRPQREAAKQAEANTAEVSRAPSTAKTAKPAAKAADKAKGGAERSRAPRNAHKAGEGAKKASASSKKATERRTAASQAA